MTASHPPGTPDSPEREEYVREFIQAMVEYMKQHAHLPEAERHAGLRMLGKLYHSRPEDLAS